LHEIKHDGYRLQVRHHGNAVRLLTRRGYDWSVRYPAIAINPNSPAMIRAREAEW
jgi:bifunctional non-homologous end joining protein LigD